MSRLKLTNLLRKKVYTQLLHNASISTFIYVQYSTMGCHLLYGITQCYLSPDTSTIVNS